MLTCPNKSSNFHFSHSWTQLINKLWIIHVLTFAGQVVQQWALGSKMNVVLCKTIISLPFVFCNTILVLWSLISFYRLHLVRRAGLITLIKGISILTLSWSDSANRSSSKDPKKNLKRLRSISSGGSEAYFSCQPSRVLPFLGLFLGTTLGVLMTLFSDSFILLRDCRGNCQDPQVKYDEWKAALAMLISTCTFHIPSSLCYLAIYCTVKKHQRDQVREKL